MMNLLKASKTSLVQTVTGHFPRICYTAVRTVRSKCLNAVESGKERYMLKGGANLRSYGEDVYKDPVPCERITSTAKSGLG